MSGVYIAFEGGEGSGKSTQAALLAKRFDGLLTREPGGSELGQELRKLLLHGEEYAIGPRAEALMMAADRAQHIDQVVRPALEGGQHVISDRTFYSSLAYQGAGRQLGIEAVDAVNRWAVDGCQPDLVVLLVVSPDDSLARLQRGLDRIERAGESFHQRVDDAFKAMAAADPDRWLLIDGSGPVEKVAARINEHIDRAIANLEQSCEASLSEHAS